MLLTLLCWLYITAICQIWGNIILSPFKKFIATADEPDLSMICFTGLAGIGILSLAASVFMPLSLTAHLIILGFAIAYLLIPNNRKQIVQQLTLVARRLRLRSFILFTACVLLILMIGTYEIIHPDTLEYHAQAIHLMEQYKAFPGLVHLRYETAMSSMWFAVQAIFRFNFIHPNNYLFVNGCVLCWFCLFICLKVSSVKNTQRDERDKIYYQFTAWLLLLIYTTLSWTQLRLTAISASPDFITTLYIWAAFYSFSQTVPGNNRLYTYLTVLFCCAALSIKLSAIAIALLPLLIVLKLFSQKKIKTALIIIGGSVLTTLPYLVRNIITTGYPLFPSTAFNLFNCDWKLNEQQVYRFQHYIKAYARFPVAGYDEAEKALQLPLSKWIPLWWNDLALPDQLLLCIILGLSLYCLMTLKTMIKEQGYTASVTLIVALTGSVLWMIMAPASRFGTGFLVPLCYSVGVCLKNGSFTRNLFDKQRTINIIIIAATAMMVLYTGYRAVYYFKPLQIVLPAGVKKAAYSTVNCQGLQFSASDSCGFSPTPCIEDSCEHFKLRGADISDGFKEK